MRIPLLGGAFCRDEPNVATAMVNRSFADRYLNGTLAIGRHLVQPGNLHLLPAEIRGIVGDARETGLDHEPPPTAYWCSGALQPGTFFLVRVQGEPISMAETIRRKIHELEPRRSVYDLAALTGHISDGYAENRLRMILLTFFAVTAIALASVGVYGTLSYLVTARQREVGLRMALGALQMQVAWQFLAQGLRIALVGSAAGVAGATALGRMMSGMLFGVAATDAATLGSVMFIVLTVSALASLLPAIRAARFDPMQALRDG
jgi:putative ABC transport system permease protein